MPRLILQPGTDDERSIELAPDATTTIGRSSENDVALGHWSLSRTHAAIAIDGDGIMLRDMGSTNGTFLGNERIEERALLPGDTFRCGQVEFRLDASGDEEVPGPSLVHDLADDLTRRPLGAGVLDDADAPLSALLLETSLSDQRDREKLQVLLKVSQTLSSPATLDHVLETILELASQVIDFDRSAILLVDAGEERLRPRIVRTRDGRIGLDEEVGGLYSETIARYVIDRSVAAVFTDAAGDARFEEAPSVLEQRMHACMCAPLKPKDDTLGVLYVDNLSAVGHYGGEDLEFLTAFANQAAVAIQNALLFEQLEREAVKRSHLQRFFPPTVVASLEQDDRVDSGPIETEVTALFADISGFTRMASGMAPSEVVAMLNDYFPVMAEAVFRQEGTLEKYIGDALLAVWGAPYRRDDDADRALRAAVEMQAAIEQLNRQWEGRFAIQIHIGLCSGPVAAGNIGTDRYLQYATIGSTTNLASRICGVAEAGEIVIDESCRRRLDLESWQLEPIPPATVKGHSEPLTLFRVLSRVGAE